MRIGIALVLLALGWVANAAARDIYVSNTAGDDRRDGYYPDARIAGGGPVRTIAKALRLAEAGDRIIVANTRQPYREALSLTGSRHGGNLVRPLVIEGGGATLDGSVPIPVEQWQHAYDDVYAYQPARMGYQQLFVNGTDALRRPSRYADSAPPRLSPQQWCFYQGKIYFCAGPRKMPADYELACCGLQTGITLYYVHDVLIRDLVVRGFQIDGVAVHDVVQTTRLENVTATGNGMSGFSARGASLVELDGCAGWGNGMSQLRVEKFARVWLYACKLRDDIAPDIDQRGGDVVVRTGLEPAANR